LFIIAGNNKTHLGLNVMCQILTKFGFSRQIIIEVTNINFTEIRPVGALHMHADRNDEPNMHFL
jgi:hypothetical protein